MEEFFRNYKIAVFQSGDPAAAEIVLSNMAVALDRVLLDVEDPFVFQPYHKALREPFDYYKFGQNYIRHLIDFRNSYVGNLSLFYEIEEKLKQGHNVILISNHQTEADPAVIALLLEKTNPHIAENLIYVAGDRVITDPLCKPFSMGRNLICVYSKKHMYDVPELADTKRKANVRSLKEMAMLLRTGSKLVWIAPSGGRDRPDPVTGEWYPAPFDSSSVDNMRRLIESSGTPGHMYPLALLCHDIMPPPSQVEKEIGERRIIGFHGTGLSVAPEIAAAGEKSEVVKDAYTLALYKSVTEQYNVLKSAIHGKQGLEHRLKASLYRSHGASLKSLIRSIAPEVAGNSYITCIMLTFVQILCFITSLVLGGPIIIHFLLIKMSVVIDLSM
ncbi:glycerol-3-phosphate acyltransferase, chloroplastic-like [Hibiscus syriacus]|uniref:glycerol-3-phosphate acyltransferase, chloroplastic-like n=1 Tax=Hibiscus syriacus TaxID=106335 RepID=UPI0019211BA5|nr:glycerol-3-phosphate acyltransferase, chloroplastic-like [Hibiscus syriacus]